MQHCRFDPPLGRIFPVKGIFTLELAWVLTWRMTFMPSMGECWQQKHTQHAPSTKMECDYLSGWIRNSHIRKNLTQNCEPRDKGGECRRRRRRWMMQIIWTLNWTCEIFALYLSISLRFPSVCLIIIKFESASMLWGMTTSSRTLYANEW